MYKISTLVIILSLAFSSLSEAQSYIGVNFNYMKALGEYGDNLTSNPRGIGFNYMFQPKSSFKHFYVGLQVGVSMYAMEGYNEAVWIDEELATIEVDEEDCFLSYSLTGRYYLVEDRLINPYLEMRFGGMSFFSTKLTEDKYDEYYDNSTTFHGTALQTGLGGGFSFHVKDNLWVDFNVIYNKGSHTNYRDIGSKDVNFRLDPEASEFESYTGNLNFGLGVQFGF